MRHILHRDYIRIIFHYSLLNLGKVGRATRSWLARIFLDGMAINWTHGSVPAPYVMNYYQGV